MTLLFLDMKKGNYYRKNNQVDYLSFMNDLPKEDLSLITNMNNQRMDIDRKRNAMIDIMKSSQHLFIAI